MATIQIREIPEDAYEVIRKRARREGRSIQSFMRHVVIAYARRPTKAEAIEAIEAIEASLRDQASAGPPRDALVAALHADRR